MKKYLVCFLFVLCIFSIQAICYADGQGPSFTGYRAVVTNNNGTTVYNSDMVVPYNTKLEVLDVVKKDGILYAACLISSEKTDDWYSQIIYLKYEDIKSDDEAMSVDDYNISSYYEGKYCLEPSGTPIRKLAASDAEIVATIPFGNYFIARYVNSAKDISSYYEGDGEYTDDVERYWLYVEYENVKGFVSEFTTKIGSAQSNRRALAYKDQYLYKYYNDEEDNPYSYTKSIKKNTVVYVYALLDEKAYVYYNGEYGFISNYSYDRADSYIEVWHDGAQLLEYPEKDSKVIASDIPVGTILKCDWNKSFYYRVEYNGTYGWIKSTSSNVYDEQDWYVGQGYFAQMIEPTDSRFAEVEYKYLNRNKQSTTTEPVEEHENTIVETPVPDIEEPADPNSQFNPEEDNDVKNIDTRNQTLDVIEYNKIKTNIDMAKEVYMSTIIIAISCVIVLVVTLIVVIILFNKKSKN